MIIHRAIPFAAAVAALLTVGTSKATQGHISINQNTTLTADHYGSITMTGDNILLDCANHKIIFDGTLPPANNCNQSPATCGVAENGRYNAQVVNCKIQGAFGAGVWLNNTKWPLISASSVSSATTGFLVQGGDHIRLTSLTASSNNGYGFIVNGAQQYILASQLSAYSNQGSGFVANNTSGLNLSGSSFTVNSGHGVAIVNSIGAFVSNNQMAFNTSYGLVVSFTTSSNFVENSAWGNNGGGCDATQNNGSNSYSGNFFSNYCGTIPSPH